MASKKIRLFKIASEINIGKEAIVEYLQSKGFDIENKPTAKLDEEMLEVVYSKFKKEKKAAEVQRDKIQRHKDTRKPSTDVKAAPKSESIPKDTPASSENEEELEDNQLVESNSEIESDKTNHDLEIKSDDVSSDTIEDNSKDTLSDSEESIKPGQVINLEGIYDGKKSRREIRKPFKAEDLGPVPSKYKETKISTEQNDQIEQREPNKVLDNIDSGVKEQKSQSELQDNIENKPITDSKEEESKKEEEPKQDKEKDSTTEKQTETSEQEIKAETEEVITNEKESDSSIVEENKVKKEETEINDKDENQSKEEVKDDGHNLKGLTVLGKIDLPSKKRKPTEEIDKSKKDKKPKPKKEVKKQVEEEDVEVVKKKFKKRRRKPTDEVSDAAPIVPKAVESTVEKEVKKKKKKKSIRDQISDKDVEKAVRETLSGMDSSGGGSRAKLKQKKRAEREVKEQKLQDEKDRDAQVLELTEFVTTSDLANLMNVSPNELILKCMELGLMVTINQRLDKDTIELIASDYDFEVSFLDEKELHVIDEEEDDDDAKLKPRSPIVTIMGHVDHGKTSLLDFIRKANVVSTEAGGITQHIGAYRVETEDQKTITFLDTPGHEAFTAMRARGAHVTDIVVLIVAADDSVMPQTIEAISHANAANVPIVVAINKIDKPDANPDRIKQQLSERDILVEEWGGKYQSVEISAKKGINVDLLLEKIILEAELLDLKANPDRRASGIIIESNMSKGFGSVATVIVQKGTMKVGDPFVAGIHFGRVRAMMDEYGNKVEEAGPSRPVQVIGFDGLPEAGDVYQTTRSDQEAREIATERKQLRREQELRQVRHTTLDEISAQIQLGGIKELFLVIKGDVAGSVEALSDSLQKLSQDEVKVVILHKGVGAITETDVMLAAASNAIVIGFNVSPNGSARKVAENEKVEIRRYDIIYDCINDIQMALEGLLSPDKSEEVISEVEVRQTFKISKVGTIAGCYVLSGKINRNDRVRLLRDGFKVFEGKIASLKRNKDDAKEVDTGFECGIQIEGFNDIKVGDFIEGFKIVEIKRTLS